MVGAVKNWGFYVKGLATVPVVDWNLRTNWVGNGANFFTTGREKRGLYAATAGFLVRLGCPLYMNIGVGYVYRTVARELLSFDGGAELLIDRYYTYQGLAGDMGLMLKIGRFTLNGGVLCTFRKENRYVESLVSLNVGIGICL